MKKILLGSLLVPFVGLTTSTMYLYPDLRYNPKQLGLASQRVYRVVKAGSKMALTYLINSSQPIEEKHLSSAIELRDAFQKNAGLYIKFGQILASLDFIIPEQYRKTFEVMCIQNNETPAYMIQQQLKDGYGDPEKIFQKWNPVPISSASIAQVHKAVLMDGREVAVKIQHPWLKEQMEGDIRLIEIFVDVAERIFPGFKYKWLAEELRVNLPKELDFQLEIKNAQKIKYELRNFKDIKIPDIYKEFCNDRIICMEFIYGDSLLDVLSKPSLYDKKKIAQSISNAFSYQIYKIGFVHSDPHQGNIMVRIHKGKQQIVLLDHGLYTNLEEKTKLSYARLWKGLLEQNVDDIKLATKELGAEQNYKLFASMVTSKKFSDLMNKEYTIEDRLRRPKEQEQIDLLIRKAAKHHKQITILLNQIDRRLLMLFKINDFLKNIDFKLGNPINNFQITYEYVSLAIYEAELYNKAFYIRLLYKIRSYIHSFKFFILQSLGFILQ